MKIISFCSHEGLDGSRELVGMDTSLPLDHSRVHIQPETEIPHVHLYKYTYKMGTVHVTILPECATPCPDGDTY